jgi:chemotaxis signal transduction protein
MRGRFLTFAVGRDVWHRSSGISSRYVCGVGKVDGQVKLLLDCETLFSGEEEAMEIVHAI